MDVINGVNTEVNTEVNTVQNRKDKWIQIRVSEVEKNSINLKAESSGMNISQYILDRVLTSECGVNTKREDVNTINKSVLTNEESNLFKKAFQELFLFLKDVSKSSILNSETRYNKWVKLVEIRDISIIDKAEMKLKEEGLINE